MGRIVIAGGGIMGSCAAYHLARAGAAADVVVVEPDPTYAFAATPRATGGIRMQHGVRENVEMSLYGDRVFSDFANQVSGGKVEFDPQFHRIGLLYLVSDSESVTALERVSAMQAGLGVEVHILDRATLESRYPSFNFDGVVAASFTPADGQIDPNAALMGFRRAAEGLGITYLKDRVVGLEVADGLVRAARLESGTVLPVDTFLNAANCWAPEICAMVGMKVPIAPMRRQQFFFDTRTPLETIPAMRFMDGLSFRPLQRSYLIGYTRFDEPRGFNWTLEESMFDEFLWPQLAERSKAFEAVKVKSGYVGHYDMNDFDANAIFGRWSKLPNFIIAAGFSGHGLQHSPAMGRAVKELIIDGGYQTIDLSRLSYRRVEENAPLLDEGMKA